MKLHMELFNKKKRQFVQSFESQEVEGLRVYFNADSEKQSNKKYYKTGVYDNDKSKQNGTYDL